MGDYPGTVYKLPDLCGLFKASEDIPGGSRQLQAECGAFKAGNGSWGLPVS